MAASDQEYHLDVNGARDPGCAVALLRWLVGCGLLVGVVYLTVSMFPEEWVLSEDWRVPAGQAAACELLFVGCDREPPDISGVWLTELASARVRLELVYLEGNEVTGNMLAYPAEGPVSWSAFGRYDFPAVSLQLLSEGEPCSLQGTMASDGQRMASTMTCRRRGGSSSDSLKLDFRRSP